MASKRFENALHNVAQKTPPIWMMRQAGRYHDHYQNLKKSYTFLDLCKKPELACETAMGPIEDFDFDISIMFSDLLFPLEALGMPLDYTPGPTLGWHLDEHSMKKLNSPEGLGDFFGFQHEALKLTRKALPDDKSLIGFVGGTWTLFGYAVEGSHKGGLKKSKALFHLYEKFSKDYLLPLLIQNIELQIQGGAEVVMVMDTAAGELSSELYNKYVAPDLKVLTDAFPGKLGFYCKGVVENHYELLRTYEWAGIGYDHRWSLNDVFEKHTQTKTSGFIQGNFDQCLLFSDPKNFETRLREWADPLMGKTGWVSGLGHGILPQTPQENVRNFVKLVREWSLES